MTSSANVEYKELSIPESSQSSVPLRSEITANPNILLVAV